MLEIKNKTNQPAFVPRGTMVEPEGGHELTKVQIKNYYKMKKMLSTEAGQIVSILTFIGLVFIISLLFGQF